MIMDKKELKERIREVENDLTQNSWSYESVAHEKKLKSNLRNLRKEVANLTPELVPGGTYSLEDFIDSLKRYTGKSNRPEELFFKEKAHLFYDNPEDRKILQEMFGYYDDKQTAYNFFNKNYSPFDITRTVVKEDKEDVKSSNIYDRMCAKTITTYRTEFKIQLKYNLEPITVFKEYTKNTTLSQSEVRNFM